MTARLRAPDAACVLRVFFVLFVSLFFLRPCMKRRTIGHLSSSALGLGCMPLSHAYGNPPDPATAANVLRKALDLGYNFFDTAAQYGFGANETLLGNVLKDRRRDIVLASKAGMFKNA